MMALNPFEGISRFIDTVGNQINLTFRSIDEFIDYIVTLFVALGFWTAIISFFLLVIATVAIPLISLKYWDSIKNATLKVLKALISST